MNTPLPKYHPLHQASKEIIEADNFHKTMIKHHVGEFDAFETAWRGFLNKIERVWNKTQAGMCVHTGWRRLESEIENLRKTDPLLCYLRHARNADEHSIQDVAREWDANQRTVRVTSTTLKVQWDPWDRPLLPITNRGIRYHPPDTHLGQPLRGEWNKGVAEPIVVAGLAIDFYRQVLDRAIDEVLGAKQG